jgi:hypothetical protein
MTKKIINLSVTDEIYNSFLISGTVIDRPGLPLLKVVDAISTNDGKTSIAIEVSPYSGKKINPRKK